MSTHQPQGAVAAPRRLTRNTQDRMLGGVCAGVANYFDIDVTLVRVLTVVGVILGFGSVACAYLVAWVLIPKY